MLKSFNKHSGNVYSTQILLSKFSQIMNQTGVILICMSCLCFLYIVYLLIDHTAGYSIFG